MIEAFKGEYRFLSNFCPCKIKLGNYIWPSAEHAYQAAKSLDEKEWDHIHSLPTAAAAKAKGAVLTLRPDWDGVKLSVMEQIVRAKFTQNVPLARALQDTFPHGLVEGNHWGDHYWGVCKGYGQNNLGKILMKVRAELL